MLFRRIRNTVKRNCWLRYVCQSERNNSAPNGQIFVKLYLEGFPKNGLGNSSLIKV
jgi:hypothetical protein